MALSKELLAEIDAILSDASIRPECDRSGDVVVMREGEQIFDSCINRNDTRRLEYRVGAYVLALVGMIRWLEEHE